MIKFETLRNKLKLIKKNKEFFFNQKTKNQKKILVEHYELTGGLIPFSYFANVLSKKYNADIYSYKVNYYNFFQKIRFIIKNLYLVGNYNIYKSFGMTIFFDGGLLAEAYPKDLLSELKWDSGIGITIDTPLGPARLDYAVQLDDLSKQKLQLGLQNLF